MNEHKRKILFVASVAIHINAFHRPYLKWFYDRGYEVHVACNGTFEDAHVSKVWNISFERSPFSLSHFSTYRQLQDVIKNNQYALVSCHTPMASVITRIASLSARKRGTQLLYTAHGFHFFKGSSIWSWLTYYPVEILLSYFTDAIVCINDEDYKLIKKKGAQCSDYYLIPGIGVNSTRFKRVSEEKRLDLRHAMKIAPNDFVVIYAAEFIERKNHKLLIDAVLKLSTKIESFKVLLAGHGILLDEIKAYVNDLGLDNHIQFLGFIDNIEESYQISDLAVSSSRQEGLGLNLVEAMMCGTPVVATVDRGHCTIIDNNVNGLLVPQNDAQSFSDAIFTIYSNDLLRSEMSKNAVDKAFQFEVSRSLAAMSNIYMRYL